MSDAANAPTPLPADVDDADLGDASAGEAGPGGADTRPSGGRSSRVKSLAILLGLSVLIGPVVGLLLHRGWNRRRDMRQVRALERALAAGRLAHVLEHAVGVRARLSGWRERRAGELLRAARALEELQRLEGRLQTSLRGGSWRVAKPMIAQLGELDPDRPADAAVIAFLRADYQAKIERSGAPKAGRSTIAGVWCALLAELSSGASSARSGSPGSGSVGELREVDKLRALAAACSPRVGAWLGVRRFVDPIDGATMLLVPGGTFEMGISDADVEAIITRSGRGLSEDEIRRERNRFALSQPVHRVTLSPYYVERTEVSNARYSRFIAAKGYQTDGLWSADGLKWRVEDKVKAPGYWGVAHVSEPGQPVIGVSWYEAQAYCRWAHKRLPTEAQWEFASAGPDGRKWPWGADWEAGRCAGAEYWASTHDAERYPKPLRDMYQWRVWRNPFFKWTPASGPSYLMAVDSMPAGASPYGALHMAGNASEWCRDWVAIDWYAQPGASRLDTAGPAESFMRNGVRQWAVQKISRGGDFTMFRAHCRVDIRYMFTPNSRAFVSGFRCVLPAGPTAP